MGFRSFPTSMKQLKQLVVIVYSAKVEVQETQAFPHVDSERLDLDSRSSVPSPCDSTIAMKYNIELSSWVAESCVVATKCPHADSWVRIVSVPEFSVLRVLSYVTS